ncbi:hypothetical protein JHK87_040154 [Glycine soja]|nr:hypothetical protein JHK87_040154 [Glycine soja]
MLDDMDYYDIDIEFLRFGIGSGGVQPSTNFTWMSCDGSTIGMEYSLPYYHFQDQKTSQTLFPSFYIDVIETKWEQDDMLHMDHFSGFLCSHRIPDVPGDRICIIDFYFSWTHPTPSNYHFPIPMPSVAKGLGTTQGRYGGSCVGDEQEKEEEDTSYKEDPFMDEEDPTTEPEIMEEDSSQDSSEDSY